MSDQRLPIPQASPGGDYLALRAEIDAAVTAVMAGGWYILGPEVEAFEAEFAAWLGVESSVGVASGTDALELALRALGVGEGDAVFTVSHTAVATVVAIERTGATPVLLDVDDGTFTLDPRRLEAALQDVASLRGARPRVVLPVHLYGQMADMRAITEAARRHGLLVVEDCAQAHGAALDGGRAGSWGDAACFSFYPTKNLGAIGDGGAVATPHAEVATRLRELRQYGWRDRYVSATIGMNSRLDELQAAILRVKLRHLDEMNDRRRAIARRYDEALAGTSVSTPATAPGALHVYHQYVIRTAERPRLVAHLRDLGIGTAIHYPVPVHQQPAYQGRVLVAGGMTVTDALVPEIVSLPMFPALRDDAVDRVAAAIREVGGVGTGGTDAGHDTGG